MNRAERAELKLKKQKLKLYKKLVNANIKIEDYKTKLVEFYFDEEKKETAENNYYLITNIDYYGQNAAVIIVYVYAMFRLILKFLEYRIKYSWYGIFQNVFWFFVMWLIISLIALFVYGLVLQYPVQLILEIIKLPFSYTTRSKYIHENNHSKKVQWQKRRKFNLLSYVRMKEEDFFDEMQCDLVMDENFLTASRKKITFKDKLFKSSLTKNLLKEKYYYGNSKI